MKPLSERLALPLPRQMRTLERDSRGYPVPYIVMRDRSGQAHFPINDARRVAECFNKKLCGICGKRLDDGMWFVGGPLCFSEEGGFFDPHSHQACAEYALQVCPYLVVPRYAKYIDDAKLDYANVPTNTEVRLMYQADRPELFAIGRTTRCRRKLIAEQQHLFIVDDWDIIEFWQHGAPCNAPDRKPEGDIYA